MSQDDISIEQSVEASRSSLDFHMVERLLTGDEDAFEWLVNTYYSGMKNMAMYYVRDEQVAEDVIQETWIAVLRSLDKFEGRSAFKTWLYGILINKAKTMIKRESKHAYHVSLEEELETASTTESVSRSRFKPSDHPHNPDHWSQKPQSWDNIPEAHLLSAETIGVIREVVNELPDGQRNVFILRDIEHWSSVEICALMNISEANQRVLLHRARSRVRAALENYLKA